MQDFLLRVFTMRQIDHFIMGGSGSAPKRFGDVFNPNEGGVQAQVVLGDAAVLERAVQAALAAQPAWAATNPQRRARVMFEFKRLIEDNMDHLAHTLSPEHGQVISDSPSANSPRLARTVFVFVFSYAKFF